MIYSQPILIVDARRTAIGRFGGALRALSPVELALPVGRALVPDELRPAIGQVVLGQMLPAAGGRDGARPGALRLGRRGA
ncbi:MAG: acetyl-CoA C-acetyltransferase, partial [Opitutaceae bacterium]